jgi:hypothetical protein
MLLGAMATVTAQSDYAEHKATDGLSIGLAYAGGASLTIDAPNNYKVSPIYSYRFGLDASYPLTPTISAWLGLGMDSRGGNYHWYVDKTVWETRRVRYFAINPGFRISALFLGLNIGIPLSGDKEWQNGPDAKINTAELDADADMLNVMIEPQLGAVIPLYEHEIGWFGLTIIAGYNVSDISDKPTFIPGEDPEKPIGSATPTLRLGLTAQMGIPNTSR